MLTRAESLGEGKRGRGTDALLVSVTGEKQKESLLLKSSWADCEAKDLKVPIHVLTSQQKEEKTAPTLLSSGLLLF